MFIHFKHLIIGLKFMGFIYIIPLHKHVSQILNKQITSFQGTSKLKSFQVNNF